MYRDQQEPLSDIKYVDIAIIGGGPAGLAAAISAHDHGVRNIVVIERSKETGGILNQCIHNGFGLHIFKEELTGPEYAARYLDKAKKAGIVFLLGTMVTRLSSDKELLCVSSAGGLIRIKAKGVILAMGCRERPRGALNIPGFRGAGIYAAGTAQRLVNIDGYMPGNKVVILGSGDIGLIMARRMCLEGADVKTIVEIMPYSGGLKRNIVQCLVDFDIPLLFKHTIVDIAGKERVEGVTIAEVDDRQNHIHGTERFIECDTILMSVGLIPENELSIMAGVRLDPATGGSVVSGNLETQVEGIFACGNVLHVHDLVDYVSEEALFAGKCAAEYVLSKSKESGTNKVLNLIVGKGLRYLIPQQINEINVKKGQRLSFRVNNQFFDQYLSVYYDEKCVFHRKKRVLTPGEMEQIELPIPENGESIQDIMVCIEGS